MTAELAEKATTGVARATAVVALGNITSRILGLAREIILANLFGAGIATDAFRIAIIIPRGIYDLLIGGHVNSALIPVLSEYAEHQGEKNLWRLVSALLNIVLLVMVVLIIGMLVLAPQIIDIVSDDDIAPETLRQATDLLRITAPALLFMSLFAILSSLLYALRRFTWPAFAASAFNLTIVIVMALLASEIGITAAALGWLIGAIMQLALQWFGLRGVQIRFSWILRHPAMATIGLLYLPVMFSLALDVLINRPFSYNLASGTGAGNISAMEFATNLVQFPQGLVATAISIAVLPTLSRQASQLSAFKDTLGEGLRLALVLIIPATVGLIVLATPIISLIFEHGEFNSTNTAITAMALRLYMLGLPFASIDLLLIFAFYAQQDTLTPAVIGLLSLIAYMVTAVVLLPYYSFFALMIADSVKHLIHVSVSGYLLMRRTGGFQGLHIFSTGIKASISAGLMGVLCLGLLLALRPVFPSNGLFDEIMLVVVPGGISGLFYLFLADRLGLSEIFLFWQQLRQKL